MIQHDSGVLWTATSLAESMEVDVTRQILWVLTVEFGLFEFSDGSGTRRRQTDRLLMSSPTTSTQVITRQLANQIYTVERSLDLGPEPRTDEPIMIPRQ